MGKKKLGFIGVGNMGGAILDGILETGALLPEEAVVFDLSSEAVKRFTDRGVSASSNVAELCKQSEMVMLCVKPNIADKVLKQTEKALEGKALLSIVAGTSCEKLRIMADVDCRILRIMPNTPAMVGQGATVLCSDTTLTQEEKQYSERIFEAIGIVEWLPEYLIDAATGISGSGPAYVAMFVEALADGAVLQGLPRQTAYRLAAQTIKGTGEMVLKTGLHPGILKDMVCSPGGTTIEAVKALEDGGMRAAVINAVIMSAEKSKKL